MRVVHQVEIQKQGGSCAKYPSSCIVRQLLDSAGLLQFGRTLNVLDLTYGQGIFYYSIGLKVKVYGFDIHRLVWVTKPFAFYNTSCEKWKKVLPSSIGFDLVVVDPPWSIYRRGWEKRGHYYGNGSFVLCVTEAVKASEHYNAPLLLHAPWKLVPPNYNVVTEVWFQGWSRLTKMPKPTWFGLLKPEGGGSRG